ncbi:MAG: thiolase family protein [Ignavibacteriae bacterium]|nr:thiolase family protein [Ignavibacteriota bacterium]
MHQHDAVIIDAVRTPIGRYGGMLRDIRPDDLSAIVMRGLLERTHLEHHHIQDVLWGCANQAGEDNRNIARQALLLAGLPHTVPGTTMNRLCGSSMDSLHHAARAIWSGDAECILVGGVESMSRAPYSIPKNQSGLFGNLTAYDTALGWRYPNPKLSAMFPLEQMGETAENLAEKYSISREAQDEFALNSHAKAIRAQLQGMFDDEIVPVKIHTRKNETLLIKKDEGPRVDTSLEKLSKLRPAFRQNGTVTAGNSSSLNDGASAILITSEKKAQSLKRTPIARIVSTGVVGVNPRFMGIGPVPATQMALKKAELSLNDIGLIELNEAFAAQSLAVIHDLQIDQTKLNVNGGAIALGHPLGCSGARIITTLVHEMKRRRVRYGLATMCIGVGQGISTIIESLHH